jgi:hypothetical protein
VNCSFFLHPELLGHIYTKNPHKHQNSHIQEAHIHGHHHPLYLKPPTAPQIRHKYLYNRLNTYNLQQEEYQQELLTIHNIMYNSFPVSPHKPHTQNPATPTTPRPTHKWASFTYVDQETTYITNIFKKSELKIAFRTTHTLGNMLNHRNNPP